MADEVQPEEVYASAPRRNPEQFEFIRYRVEGAVARLTLHRPEHNLLNETMLRELADGIGLIAEDPSVKLIALDAAGKVFSGGVDVGEYTAARAFPMLDAFHSACIAMVEAPQPVLVIVDGPAIGGGAELIAYGDLVVATPRARFALPEITIGVFPPLASTMFPYIIGPKRALELVLTGEAITAERARELGLVNRLVPEAQLQVAVNELIGKITAQSGAVLGMAKKAVLGGMGMPLREALRNSMNIFLNELYRLEDSQEGLRALLEKRKPQWKNR
ncbi:MAG TPA: enoyl-CoA hydratase/isomerase family protein [Candidatus Dormibacteraeota bacterium]|nr:enoyl-CoA hydratase/isomerase family protein [Candidatus Dormibacteraeota bacterium]